MNTSVLWGRKYYNIINPPLEFRPQYLIVYYNKNNYEQKQKKLIDYPSILLMISDLW